MAQKAGHAAVGLLLGAGLLLVAASPVGRTQLVKLEKMGPEEMVQVHMDARGEASISAWSRNGEFDSGPVLSQVLRCGGDLKEGSSTFSTIRCSSALRRDGLALEGVVDLAPIVRALQGSSSIQFRLDSPASGFSTVSFPMTEQREGPSIDRSADFAPGVVPPPITIRFGYRREQLAGVYLPLIALALAITLMVAGMARIGLAALARSVVLLGTVVWMAVAAQVQADGPLLILLHGRHWANPAVLAMEFWPPLLCAACGVAVGSWLRGGPEERGKFGQVFWGFGAIPLVLTCAVGTMTPFERGDWVTAALWVVAAPVVILLRRGWTRRRGLASVHAIGDGALRERVAALGARAGYPTVGVLVMASAGSQILSAYALPGKRILLSAPLLRTLSQREVDAVVAHELSHFRHSNRALWMPLGIAMVLFATPVRDALEMWPYGIYVALLAPVAVFFGALRGARRREFQADAGAAALTGDPRAMISSLARVMRSNGTAQDMPAIAEWFSSHPSSRKRTAALAALAHLNPAEVESLCTVDDAGAKYEVPTEEGGTAIFTPDWQKKNAGAYVWAAMIATAAAALVSAGLVDRFGGSGIRHLAVSMLGGIVLGCLLTKLGAAAVMAGNYGRLRRKLEARLGVRGRLAGLAMDGEARVYNGFRFFDAGLLWFEGGRLRYQSERVSIALNPADVVEVCEVAASPSAWMRRQPMVRFRDPGTGHVHSFILHPVQLGMAAARLLRELERWKATGFSVEGTSISGFQPIAGQPYRNPLLIAVARAFLIAGGITLVAAVLLDATAPLAWWFVGYAVAVAACVHLFMFLPALLYRQPSPPTGLASPVDAT
jgi:Zn-dependent protease with chaperone function